MLSGMIPLGLDPISKFIEGFVNPTPAPVTGKKIEFSKVTKEYKEFFNFMDPSKIMEKVPSPELLEVLVRPDQHDPLSLVHSEAMLAVAKEKGVNVIANLPDSVANSSFLNMLGKADDVTMESFMTQLRSGENTNVVESAGWMTVKPSRPDEARTKRVNRVALARFINKVRAKETMALDDLAEYAYSSDSPLSTPAALPYIMFSAPSAMGSTGGITDWNMLRFYGSLSVTQRSNLTAGEKMPFSTLTPQQKTLVNKLAYGSSARLNIETGKPADEAGGFFAMVGRFMPQMTTDFRQEPTELMPNGLPVQGAVTVKVDLTNFGAAMGPDGKPNRMYGSLGVDEIAMFRWMRDEPMLAAASGALPKVDKLRIGERKVMEFAFWLAEDVTVRHRLQEDTMPKDPVLADFNSLPPAMEALVKKKVDGYKKTPLSGILGGGGGTVKPPLP